MHLCFLIQFVQYMKKEPIIGVSCRVFRDSVKTKTIDSIDGFRVFDRKILYLYLFHKETRIL